MNYSLEQFPHDSSVAMEHAVERLQNQLAQLLAENPTQTPAGSAQEAAQLDETYFQRNIPRTVHEEQRFLELFGYYPYA
jgi:hypothetical protein